MQTVLKIPGATCGTVIQLEGIFMNDAGSRPMDGRDDWSSRSFAAYTLNAGDASVRFALPKHAIAAARRIDDMPELLFLLRGCLEAEGDA